MKQAIKQLTAAARKVRDMTGEDRCSVSVMVTSHSLTGPEKVETSYHVHLPSQDSTMADTLDGVLGMVLQPFTPEGLMLAARRKREEAATLEAAAARMEGKE